MTTARQDESAAGFIQASSVSPTLRSSEALSGITTIALMPLKESAEPKRPAAAQVAPEIVPGLPLPDESATTVPLPSSNEHAATRPLVAAPACGTKAAA